MRAGTWVTRALANGAIATAVVALAVMPAFGHASFPAASGFGFAPNTSGGTGAVGSTPPYAAGTNVTIHTRVPFEQTELFNGSDDTTVEVRITVPDGWTSPACGAAMTQVNNAGTNNTNQPGSTVAGWSCEILDAGGRKVIHWSGPQVVAPATSAASAQFFVFTVKTPSPSVQTTYNGTGGTEGYIVSQRYASGQTSYWIPNAAFPGSPPEGAESIVASGLVRTVAAFDPNATTTTTTSTTVTTTPPTTVPTTATTVAAATATTVAPAVAATTTTTAPVSTLAADELPATGSGAAALALFGGASLAAGALLLRGRRSRA